LIEILPEREWNPGNFILFAEQVEDRSNMVDWVLDALQAEMIKECIAKVQDVRIRDDHGQLAFSMLAEESG
jgi:hypothetical protein